ncbi:MAG: HAMP domain-containing sensor histidine kinase [bacterium]
MEIRSLKSKRYLFYLLFIILILADIITSVYFINILESGIHLLNNNQYKVIDNLNIMIERDRHQYSSSDELIRTRRHSIGTFLKKSGADRFVFVNKDLEQLYKYPEQLDITPGIGFYLHYIAEDNTARRVYYGNYDMYTGRVDIDSTDALVYAVLFHTDFRLLTGRIRLYFYFKFLLIILIVIIGLFLVKSMEGPLRKIAETAAKLNIDLDSDNTDDIVGVFGDSVEELVELNRIQRTDAGRMKEKIENMRKRMIQMEGISQLGEMSAGIAHQMNNYIASIKGLTEIMEKKGTENVLPALKDEVTRLEEFTERFIRFTRAPHIEKSRVNLSDIIVEMLNYYDLRSSSGILNDVYVKTDSVLLREILGNIFDNIKTYTESEEIGISISRLPQYIKLQITDRGPGFPQSVVEEPHKPKPEHAAGFGLGIPTIMKFSSILGHQIELSNTAQGSKITIRFDTYE